VDLQEVLPPLFQLLLLLQLLDGPAQPQGRLGLGREGARFLGGEGSLALDFFPQGRGQIYLYVMVEFAS